MKKSALSLPFCLGLLACPLPAAAAAEPMRPVLPKLSAAQVANLDKQRELYRREVADRVHRGEITAAAAKNLVDAREWQVAEQLWGLAPADSGASPGAADAAPPQWDRPYLYQGFAYDFHTLFPYFFLPSPGVWGPRAYSWGPTLCTGGWGRGPGLGVCR